MPTLTSDYTVTEIANHLGISRRSIQLWAKKENWNALRDYINQHEEMQDFTSVRSMAFFNSIFSRIYGELAEPPAISQKETSNLIHQNH